MASVKLIDVCKVYQGGVKAVKDFNLDIKDGEFIVFVGPSGCGKSTTLRMVAGLEEITSGKVYIDDTFVNNLEPKDRDIAMVFQNYALYPHMSVYENLAYSLKCHHENKDVIKEKVEHVSKLLGIEEYLLRKPKELSGGQRQRVALGRCIIRNPKVFLFDEPLSNLDAKLRVAMRSEISKLHKQVNGTFIYVTHDQTEAMTMGDRIVVMKDGLVQQVDTPVNLYEHPINVFVATFLGSPQMNILKVHLKDNAIALNSRVSVHLSEKTINKLVDGYEDKDVLFGIRPSDFTLGNKDDYDLHIKKINLVEKLGNETLIYFNIEDREEQLLASLKLAITDDISGEVYLKINKEAIHLFNEEEDSILRVNEFNYIRSEIEVKNDDIVVNNKFTLSHKANEFVDERVIDNFLGYLKIKSKDIKINKTNDDDLELNVTITAIDKRSDSHVYFAKLKDNTRVTFETSKEIILKEGEKVNLYVLKDDVLITDQNKNTLTINGEIIRPIRNEVISKIGKNYYIVTSDKEFAKNKYFIVDKIYDLNNNMLLNTRNHKEETFSLKVERDVDYYATMIIYVKYKKEKNKK